MTWSAIVTALVRAIERIAAPLLAWIGGFNAGQSRIEKEISDTVKTQQEAQDAIDQEFERLARDRIVRERLRNAILKADSADRDGKL